MIITHTQNAEGQRRLYLGGKSSIECWLEPKADGIAWSFHWEPAATGQQLDADQAREAAVHLLRQLSDQLNVAPNDLAAVPFESIAALHATDPFSGRRVSQGRRRSVEHGFMSTAPNIRRPQAEFAERLSSGRYRSR